MSVLILMYHRTPLTDIETGYDVPLGALRSQVQAMADAGVRFIPLSQALDPRNYGDEVVVSITFDDGDRTNLGAFEVLAELGVPSTAMIVSQFCTERPADFMTPGELNAAPATCEFGAHGHTHTNLAALAPLELKAELSNSKQILEDILQRPVTTMTAPGGKINAAVTRAALDCGFEVIGSSAEVLNMKPRHPLGRFCVWNSYGPDTLLKLVTAGRPYWMRRNAWFNSKQLAKGALRPLLNRGMTASFVLGGMFWTAVGGELCTLVGG